MAEPSVEIHVKPGHKSRTAVFQSCRFALNNISAMVVKDKSKASVDIRSRNVYLSKIASELSASVFRLLFCQHFWFSFIPFHTRVRKINSIDICTYAAQYSQGTQTYRKIRQYSIRPQAAASSFYAYYIFYLWDFLPQTDFTKKYNIFNIQMRFR